MSSSSGTVEKHKRGLLVSIIIDVRRTEQGELQRVWGRLCTSFDVVSRNLDPL